MLYRVRMVFFTNNCEYFILLLFYRVPTRVLLDFMYFMCFQFSKYVYFMSFGRFFLEIVSVLCPVQITLTGPSIKDIRNKGEGIKEKRNPYKNYLPFQ